MAGPEFKRPLHQYEFFILLILSRQHLAYELNKLYKLNELYKLYKLNELNELNELYERYEPDIYRFVTY